MHLHKAALAILLVCTTPCTAAVQRDFPTGEPNVNVTYLDAAGPGHPTGCIISIMAGLPDLGLSLAMYSNNTFTMTVLSKRPLAKIEPNSNATVKINSIYIFAKVTSVSKHDGFNILSLSSIDNTSVQIAYDAVNNFIHNATRVDVVADDSQLPSVTLPPEPGVGDALTACQKYMIAHWTD